MHSVEITEIYSHAFWQQFRESNGFAKEVPNELISRDVFSMGKFRKYPYYEMITVTVHSVEK